MLPLFPVICFVKFANSGRSYFTKPSSPLPPYFVEVIYGWSLVDFNIPQAPNLEHIVSHTGYIKSYANYPALDCI